MPFAYILELLSERSTLLGLTTAIGGLFAYNDPTAIQSVATIVSMVIGSILAITHDNKALFSGAAKSPKEYILQLLSERSTYAGILTLVFGIWALISPEQIVQIGTLASLIIGMIYGGTKDPATGGQAASSEIINDGKVVNPTPDP